jgi:hypothetical protein
MGIYQRHVRDRLIGVHQRLIGSDRGRVACPHAKARQAKLGTTDARRPIAVDVNRAMDAVRQPIGIVAQRRRIEVAAQILVQAVPVADDTRLVVRRLLKADAMNGHNAQHRRHPSLPRRLASPPLRSRYRLSVAY